MTAAWLWFLIIIQWFNILVPEVSPQGVSEQFNGERIDPSESRTLSSADFVREPVRNETWQEPFVEELSAKSFVVMDKASGRILWSRDPNMVWPLASLTKLMTAILFLEEFQEKGLDWDTVITMTREDKENGAVYVYRDESFTLRDTFNASLIGSINNMTNALVRGTGFDRQEFVFKMNKRARLYGLWHTQLNDVTGLNAANVSTSKEVAWLLKEALAYPEIKSALLMPVYEFRTINTRRSVRVINTNILLNGTLKIGGGKTGHIYESQYNLAVNVADDSQNEILVVVLGSKDDESRFSEARMLAGWAFENYEWL